MVWNGEVRRGEVWCGTVGVRFGMECGTTNNHYPRLFVVPTSYGLIVAIGID